MKMIATLVFLTLSATAHAASTSDSDMPDEVRALLMKEKAKGTLRAAQGDSANDNSRKSGASGGGKSGCSMDIGNVNSGRSGGTPRNVTTIVTGPVIQMNNKCN